MKTIMKTTMRWFMAAMMAFAACATADAQSSMDLLREFGKQIQSKYEGYYDELYQKKDYAKAEDIINEMLALNESLPDSIKTTHRTRRCSIMMLLACIRLPGR